MSIFDRIALRAGMIAGFLVIVLIYAGSRGLKHFDWALMPYAIGAIFAAFAMTYRYTVWAQRPPTLMYLKRGWQLFLQRRRNTPLLGMRLLDGFVLQKFISNRSLERWMMHICLSWGGTLAFALTFPLVFGWIHFETLSANAEIYRVFIFGFPVEEFSIHSVRGFLHFNVLNVSAMLMLAGLTLSFKIRMTDKGEIATQSFSNDVLPLLLLFAVSVSGLMLSASSRLLSGYGFPFIAAVHAVSVIGLLLYFPFGKLFHAVQRPLSLGVSFYKDAGRNGRRACCLRCGGEFAAQMHVDDLKTVLHQLGLNFQFATANGQIHYQDICPTCRRRLFSLNQGKALGR
jgi:nitrate reductase gamma subunit